MRRALILAITVGLLAVLAAPRPVLAQGGDLTDEAVQRAIDKAKEYLIGLGQNANWPGHANFAGGVANMGLFTLAYIGEHPNRPVIGAAMDAAIARASDQVYVRSLRAMALAVLLNKLNGPKRDTVRVALIADTQWLVNAQGKHGGWDYKSLQNHDGRLAFSNTQMAILALWQASLVGVEIPAEVWSRAQALYYKKQQADGSWNYGDNVADWGGGNTPGYGSMTAAGLASVYICADMLDLASGCPCRSGKSGGEKTDLNRHIDQALDWLGREFRVDVNPKWEKRTEYYYYWLYAAERVGIAAGYKYFGTHNWFREGAEYLISQQNADGSWKGGDVADTCFATLFLYKGRAPILYEKLQIANCEWNNHRRDIANLTSYIEKAKEQSFHWQIVSLVATVEELHDAPILYVSVETAPQFTDDEKKKLRAFTDTGGTILFEASCGAPAAKEWFTKFAKELWPEWSLKPLGPDHPVFLEPNPLAKQRPEIMGLDDGLRTCVFYAMDDISCPWQTKAIVAKEYLFKWGINLFTYATDKGKLRSKLASREPAKSERYTSAVKAGAKANLVLARLKTNGDWITNRNYKGLDKITADLAKKAAVTLRVADDGLDATALAGNDIAYMTGSKEVTLAKAQGDALKKYLAGGGFLWAEAAGGSSAFDQSFRKLAADIGLELRVLDRTAPMLTGNFKGAMGYNLTTGVQFRRALKMLRPGRAFAEMLGIYQDGKLVGLYSPFDIVFSATPYDANGCKGYEQEDAAAVATNILISVSSR